MEDIIESVHDKVVQNAECSKCGAKRGEHCTWNSSSDSLVPHHARVRQYWNSVRLSKQSN